MASQPSGSKSKKGIRSFLKETLHVRSRSKSPSQPSSQQPSNVDPGQSIGATTTTKTANLERPVAAGGSGYAAGKDISNTLRPISPPNAAWADLGVALKSLKDAAKSFPTLVSTIELFVTCLDGLEKHAKGWSDYEGSATNLAGICNLLEQSTGELDSGLTTSAVLGIALSLQQQVMNLQGQLDCWAGRDASLAVHGHTDVVDMEASYKQIQKLFGQLEANLSVDISSATSEDMIAKLLERLNPANNSAHGSRAATDIWRTCTEDTRTGILKQLDDWALDPQTTPVCWMSGTQGTGKTTIARTFCERLEGRKLLAASFICTRTSAECNDPSRIVPTIAYQLSEYSVPFRRALHETLSEYPVADSDDGLQQFERLIQQPMAKAKDAMPSSVLVMVDGLDECGGQEGQKLILAILDRYAKEVPLRFLVTNRQKPEVGDEVDGHDKIYSTIHLDDIPRAIVRHDLEQYFKIELRALTPTPAQLEKLVDRTDMLFICAAVLVRFIMLNSTQSSPHERLELILSMTVESTKKHAYIDALYAAILRSVLEGEEMEENKNTCMRMVLWTVLFAQESISVETIAALAGINDIEDVKSALQPLRPVLHQSEDSGLVLPLHASLPEFMLDHERSGAFFYDIAGHSRLVAERCFGVMEAGLRFNICGLESSFVPDRDVKGLEDRIKERISATLAYACRHWATHLELPAICDRLRSALEEFLSCRLLFWMEVLNLRKEIGAGVRALIKTSRWLKATDTLSSDLAQLVRDTCDFVTRYAAHPIRDCTPHIYLSALPFCPPSSQVYKRYWNRTTGLLQLQGGLMDHRQTAALTVWQIGNTFSVHYSPDGNMLAWCQDGSVRIIDTHDGSRVAGPPKPATEHLMCIAFSPDGSKLAAGSAQGTIRLWNIPSWEPLTSLLQDPTGAVWSIAFSPDGALIASSSADRSIRTWSVKDGALAIGPLDGHADWKTPVTFSPDGTHVASVSADNAVRVWNIRDATPTYTDLTGHTTTVSSLAFTSDGSRIVSGSFDYTVRVWSTSSIESQSVLLIAHPDPNSGIAISPNGKYVASSDANSSIRVWDIDDGTTIAGPFLGHQRYVSGIAFSPDGTRIATDSFDRTIRIWGVYNGVLPPARLNQSPTQATSIMFAPTDTRMFATSAQGVTVWDVDHESFPPIKTPFESLSLCSLPISPDGSNVAVFLGDHSVEMLSTEDGKLVAGPFRGHTDSITSAAFSSDGTCLATGSKDCTIWVWGTDGRGLIAGPLVGHAAAVVMVSLSSDGSRVVSCSSDNSIRVWSIHDSIIEAEVSSQYRSMNGASKVFDGWTMGEDGWVVNYESSVLFWVPLDFAAPPSPHTELSVHYQHGPCTLPRQKLLVGPNWKHCYVSE